MKRKSTNGSNATTPANGDSQASSSLPPPQKRAPSKPLPANPPDNSHRDPSRYTSIGQGPARNAMMHNMRGPPASMRGMRNARGAPQGAFRGGRGGSMNRGGHRGAGGPTPQQGGAPSAGIVNRRAPTGGRGPPQNGPQMWNGMPPPPYGMPPPGMQGAPPMGVPPPHMMMSPQQAQQMWQQQMAAMQHYQQAAMHAYAQQQQQRPPQRPHPSASKSQKGSDRNDAFPSTVKSSDEVAQKVMQLISEENAKGNGFSKPSKPTSNQFGLSSQQSIQLQKELALRNKPFTDAELDELFPTDGYAIVEPPADYVPQEPPQYDFSIKIDEALQQEGSQQDESYYQIPDAQSNVSDYGIPITTTELAQNLPPIPLSDMRFFGKLLEPVDEDKLTAEEKKERLIMKSILKVKNGTAQQRKQALKLLTKRAKELGAAALLQQILPLLTSPTLDLYERHLLVKVLDRILFKLQGDIRPFVDKILMVVSPMLLDGDHYARLEGQEIIANLAKAAGLATFLMIMRSGITSPDSDVRDTTARCFAIVAQSLGVPAILPFLRAVCKSNSSEARHTGAKIVQQIAILMGVAVLPHLRDLVSIIEHNLDEPTTHSAGNSHEKTLSTKNVQDMTATALSALAESSAPYGIEAFRNVLKPLWQCISIHSSHHQGPYLRAMGSILPLLSPEDGGFYAKELVPILINQFGNTNSFMKSIVLKVLRRCLPFTNVITKHVLHSQIAPVYFKCFWIQEVTTDRGTYKQVVKTTVELSKRSDISIIMEYLANYLKDDSESMRKMALEAISRVIDLLGAADIPPELEKRLVDGMMWSYQNARIQSSRVILHGFGKLLRALGSRCKPYLPEITGAVRWRIANNNTNVRQLSADLISELAPILKECGQDQMLMHMGTVLYEQLDEEFPEVLSSILAALRSVVTAKEDELETLKPPVRDLLPRLTPILKNRNERVQENCIRLVGAIAQNAPREVNAREWMRICFEMLEMLKAYRRSIRQATIETFGYIAQAIGPQEVLTTLLSNLKVQERTLRVCTTVAIAVVADSCGPFTVLPALMNEYRVPELNVQNGVLKALAFMFEYIGEMSKDYIFAVVPLLEDALIERDPVHRQTACTVVKNLALGCYGLNCEDALVHLLNFVWPNIFETSPHVIQAVFGALDGLRVGLGPSVLYLYCLQGLFHPARNTRRAFWRVYNNLYVYHQDVLVAVSPPVPSENEEVNDYRRHDLELML
uniref:Splicing factor 3B subunit 1 domain-containing protein n=1 Tax=Percolomonas cosmopolitus TaxID=63605 RepID=A0A7S1KNL9_9EUKA|mmetsp:Transcript_2323/g.8665  ORF Transcript_2323/g.8665 Transcript_2323/m.8665 type:complete len:1224 (+) Transcript_2323:327-3998(+)|eukprot:CAMPEP_0117451574 /NCGR_PEP_ID=MMETSP0759-20121206/9084_1 /TAXON_ID=63605 /ORGANISM="Percolomonas cosmopolitus, Strain WS" /LENGTH=1223 /DNA_ID=CAMNT_0005244191 /DNA_START=101 /DNA_END=3772 /DNA_ORIENTATION=-